MTTTSRTTSQQELFRYLEDRFECARACAECARASTLRASLMDPGGPKKQEAARRSGILCAEVCEATCQVLSRHPGPSDRELRARLEWCRDVCLECAEAFDECPGAEAAARNCRDCARSCSDFIATLR
ncbi:ferredoxin [Streptomyces populi]|uniref:Ferredoxin n=1 Tax=Streptomyces populi TaxID=2058924 RepID=A0A2I0SQC5_9ACTN|nr:ferredoxin [Streptomyces populi]PKT72132.1 ferredoxin [Streptomyces populi]